MEGHGEGRDPMSGPFIPILLNNVLVSFSRNVSCVPSCPKVIYRPSREGETSKGSTIYNGTGGQ